MTLAVVMCCYNGARYVAEQLASIECQSHPPDRLRIYEWGSADDTANEVETFLATTRLNARMFQLGQAEGVVRSFKLAIEHLLRTEPDVTYIALCDQDDVWEAEKLDLTMRAMRSAGDDPAIFFSDVSIVDADGAVLAPSRFAQSLYFTARPAPLNPALFLANPVVGMTMTISREIAQAFADMPETELFMHDWALMMCGLLMEARITFSPRSLVRYRQHRSNVLGVASSDSRLRLLLGMTARMDRLNTQYRVFRHQFPDALRNEFFSAGMIADVIRAGFLRKRYRAVLAIFLMLELVSRSIFPRRYEKQKNASQ